MYNNLIAISGLKASGKNEAANMLQYLLNTPKFMHNYQLYKLVGSMLKLGKYKVTSFAYPLKRTLAALLNIDINKFEDREFKEKYYIYFPELRITNNPPKYKTISDNKFSRLVANKNFWFIQDNYISIRQLLQVFGTEIMRGIFGDKLWILSTIKSKHPLIISDLRFKTELDTVKELGGIVIYISRKSTQVGNHASEKEVIDMLNNNQFDIVINNDLDKSDLFYKLKKSLKDLTV